MKDLYFMHDYNALNDNKIFELRAIYGMEGYGVYWAILEAMSRSGDLALKRSERALGALSLMLQPRFDMETYISDCIDIGLFASDGETFWSESLRRRMEERLALSDKRRAAGKRHGARAAEGNFAQTNAEQTSVSCSGFAGERETERETERKNENESERESEKRRGARFSPPTAKEVEDYAHSQGLTGLDPGRFVDFYASKGWKVGETPMEDWRAAARNWSRREADPARAAPKNPALQYEQRPYTDDDYADIFIDLSKEPDWGN